MEYIENAEPYGIRISVRQKVMKCGVLVSTALARAVIFDRNGPS